MQFTHRPTTTRDRHRERVYFPECLISLETVSFCLFSHEIVMVENHLRREKASHLYVSFSFHAVGARWIRMRVCARDLPERSCRRQMPSVNFTLHSDFVLSMKSLTLVWVSERTRRARRASAKQIDLLIFQLRQAKQFDSEWNVLLVPNCALNCVGNTNEINSSQSSTDRSSKF